MHTFEMPQDYVNRVIKRQGRPHLFETFGAPKTALVVVDMQNYYRMSQAIVPNVNRLAAALRKAGGKVVWLQNLASMESLESWSVRKEMESPEKAKLRCEALQRDAHGFQLWPTLDVCKEDERVVKRRYSAFIPGSSNIENVLQDNGIDTLIVTGVATNVCCDSTARDAMMLNYRTLMVSDGCATSTDGEHAAALGNFYLFFGDVQTTDEVILRLRG